MSAHLVGVGFCGQQLFRTERDFHRDLGARFIQFAAEQLKGLVGSLMTKPTQEQAGSEKPERVREGLGVGKSGGIVEQNIPEVWIEAGGQDKR